MIDAGLEMVRALEHRGVSIAAALWRFVPEVNEWRLLLASPDVRTKGPRVTYDEIYTTIKSIFTHVPIVSLSMVDLADPDDEAVRQFHAFAPGPGVGELRVSQNVAGGHFVDDVLIYRST